MPSLKLQGNGAADNVNVAVCRNRCFVAIKIHQRKIPFLKLLVLITNVQADGVGQQTGAVVCGAQAQADDDLVGIEIIDLRIASGLEGDSSYATPPRTEKFLLSAYSAPIRGISTSSN